jgi:hypothetical protein
MKPYLVFLCAGDTSLHLINEWNTRRNFDLCINYYGNDKANAEHFANHCEYIFYNKGPKWNNISTVLRDAEFWKNYSFLWIPDDDIELHVNEVNKMFDIVARENIPLSQPSLFPKNVDHPRLIHQQNYTEDTKPTDFVEIQMPCFDVKVFQDVVWPILLDNKWNISGWGFDVYWSHAIHRKRLVNSVVATHTKPVQTNNGFYKSYNCNPFEEMKVFLQKYNIKYP